MTLTASERKRFTTGVSIDIVISLLDIGFLATLIWIVQWYLQPQAGHTLSRVFGTGSLQPIGFFFVAFAVKNGAGFLQAQSQFRFSGRVAVRLSEQNLGAFQEAAYTEFVQGDMAQQIRQINHQPFDFCTYILSGMQQLFTQAILVGVAISAILLYNAALFLFLLLVLLPPVIAVFLFMKRTQHVAKTAIRSTNERSLQALIDALKGYVEANMFGSRQFFRDRYIQARAQFSHVYFRTIAVQAMPGRMIESFAVLGLLLLLALSSRTGSDSSFLLIGTFMAAAYKIIPGLVKMINLAGQMKAYEFPVGTEQPEKRAQADALNCPSIEGLSLRNLSHAFAGRQVLDPVTLDVNPGDFVGIRGASGIGKTTLLNLLVGFLEPTGGTISVNGQRLAPRELRSLWPAVAYNRQQAFLMQDSISRNITLGKPLDEDRFQNIVRKTGLAEILATFAEGADRIIAENGRDLSGGQQQRICLARTFYKEADLILLDEPFNELDAASELRLLRYCRQLAASGKMILMISHHERSLSFCTKRFTLNDTRKDAHPAPAGLSEV